MKKLLLILLCLPIVGFGQLGDYYTAKDHPKAKGVDFTIKVPDGYEASEGKRTNTIQVFNKKNSIPITIHIYSYLDVLPEMSLHGKNRNTLKSAVKDIIEAIKLDAKIEYYESGGYPGYIAEGKESGVTSYQLNTFLENQLFIVGFTGLSISETDRELLKEMANTLYFKTKTK